MRQLLSARRVRECVSVRNRLFTPLVLFLCLAAVVSPRAGAASRRTVTSYEVPGCLSGGEDLAPAARKGVLFRACAKRGQRVSGTLAHLLPSGKLLRRHVPRSKPGPILGGPAGEIWSVAKFEKSPAAGGEELSIDRIAASGNVKTFPLGSAQDLWRSPGQRPGRRQRRGGLAGDRRPEAQQLSPAWGFGRRRTASHRRRRHRLALPGARRSRTGWPRPWARRESVVLRRQRAGDV